VQQCGRNAGRRLVVARSHSSRIESNHSSYHRQSTAKSVVPVERMELRDGSGLTGVACCTASQTYTGVNQILRKLNPTALMPESRGKGRVPLRRSAPLADLGAQVGEPCTPLLSASLFLPVLPSLRLPSRALPPSSLPYSPVVQLRGLGAREAANHFDS